MERLKIVISLIVTIGLAVSGKAAPQRPAVEPARQHQELAMQDDEIGMGREEATIVSIGGLIASYNRRLPLEDQVTLIQAVLEAAEEYELDPLLVASVIAAESSFHPRARSRCGAEGLMQLTRPVQPWLGVSDPYDIRQNVAGGCKYLHGLARRFGRIDLVLAAYNAGPTRVARLGRVPEIKETICYVSRVIKLQERLKAEMKTLCRGVQAFPPSFSTAFPGPVDGGAPLPIAKPGEKPDHWLIAALVREGVKNLPSQPAPTRPGAGVGKRRNGERKPLPPAVMVEPGNLNDISQRILIARADQDLSAPNQENFPDPAAVPFEYEQRPCAVAIDSGEILGEREVYLGPHEELDLSGA